VGDREAKGDAKKMGKSSGGGKRNVKLKNGDFSTCVTGRDKLFREGGVQLAKC